MADRRMTAPAYWFAHGTSNPHFGWSPNKARIQTGQSELEIFSDERAFLNRLSELGIDVEIAERNERGEVTADPREREWIVAGRRARAATEL